MSSLRQRHTQEQPPPLKDVVGDLEIKKEKELKEQKNFEKSNQIDKWQIIIASLMNLSVLYLSKNGTPFLAKFYTLQYQYPGTDYYNIGLDDIYFVIYWIINLMFLRSLLIVCVFKPLAKILHITTFKATQRFIEQWWSLFYYTISWCCGVYLYYNSNYFFNCVNLYANWPHDELSYYMKTYYLIQTASWFQQFLVLHIEERRKDHLQMLSHHIVTILLCTGSYRWYFTRVGHVILMLMDIVDVTLSFAKILKYSGFQRLCDLMFGVFMMTWIVSRHGFYNYVLFYSWKNARDVMNMNCSRFADGSFYKLCYTDVQINFFLSLLAALQVIMCVWMYMIVKVAIRVVTGGDADDIRSDSE